MSLILIGCRRMGLAALATSFVLPSAMATPSFRVLSVPPGSRSPIAYAVSADGQVIAGAALDASGLSCPLLWNHGAVTELPMVSSAESAATALSADGSTAVGYGGNQALAWDAVRSTVFALPTGGAYADARGVSGNGDVIVGSVNIAGRGDTAFRWSAESGTTILSNSLGVWLNYASAISADASTIVGSGQFPTSSGAQRAFRIGSDGSVLDLGVLPGGRGDSYAYAVSAIGDVVVGASTASMANGTQALIAFCWTEYSGMQSLGLLAGGTYSVARSVSADGTVIVGSADGPMGGVATVWQNGSGPIVLQSLLSDLGLNSSNLILRQAMGVTADGLTIVGIGDDPDGVRHAWVATIPSPSVSLPLIASWWAILRRRRCNLAIATPSP